MKKALAFVLAAVMAFGVPAAVMADDAAELDYPKSNITCIIPYGAGGTMDMLSRSLFESIPDGILPKGVNFVVENIAGSGGLVGTEQALTKPADGYTICGVNGDLIINRAIGATDIILQEDFIPIVCLQDEPYCLIGPSQGDCSSLEGFIEKLKTGDNAVSVAITGMGSPGGLASVALSKAFGKNVKTVVYDDSATSALAVVTGEVDATFAPVTVVTGQIEAGTLKVIAVTTAEESDSLPGVPSIAQSYEECADLDLHSVCFLGALGDTDPAIVDWLVETLNAACASESYKSLTEPMKMTPKVWDVDGMIEYCNKAYDFYAEIAASQAE